MGFSIDRKSALIIVDVQKDFCLGGILAVPEGDKTVPILNDYIKKFEKAKAVIYATRDWHPPNHISFKTQGGPWPPHCIQGTFGAEFHPNLNLFNSVRIISKGYEPDKEAFSGFEGTELKKDLKRRRIERLFIGGLAVEYCVKKIVLDALELGFKVVLLEDAIRGMNVKPDDSEKAIREMLKKGAEKAVISQVH